MRISAAVAYRSSGFFASARMITASSATGKAVDETRRRDHRLLADRLEHVARGSFA